MSTEEAANDVTPIAPAKNELVTVFRWPVLEVWPAFRRTAKPVASLIVPGRRSTRFSVLVFLFDRWNVFRVKDGAARRVGLRDYLLDLSSVPPYKKGTASHATSDPKSAPSVEPSPDG